MDRALSIGRKINNEANSEQYTVTGILGKGASAIAYNAILDNGCYTSMHIIKEYCPSYIELQRDDDGRIRYEECERERFEKGLAQFVESGKKQNEIRERASLRNQTPPIIKNFRANNTVYLDVTPFEGKTFENIQDFSLLERLKICLSIAKLAGLYHKEGYLCLDIKPSNIFVLKETTEIVEFIDFDSVREKETIAFGNSLSFTKLWAAPEQENPYSVECISEATDIYTIGEIVFWSLFGRHSCVKEHRASSKYPFYESCFSEIQRKTVRELLENLFRNTIRSSASNRFASVEPIVDILKNIIDTISQKEVINSYEVYAKDFFIGRDYDLELIKNKLLSHKILFVSGIPGIGKSEIVKNYVNLHKNEYNNILYWFYEGDFEKMVCSDYSVSISNFSQDINETDTEYSRRKLKKLGELVDEHSIIIIDNLDVLIEDINSPELWNKIKTYPGKIIVTTRCVQKNYERIKIGEISDTSNLRKIFYEHCPSSYIFKEEEIYVDKVIAAVNRHTYEVELLAAHAEAEKKLPSELLEDMKEYGIGSFDKTEICILKDGVDVASTFREHLQKIFSLNNLSVEQKKLLIKLAFIPNGGIDIRQFKLFYSMTGHNDLNWLIMHGLVYETIENKCTVVIHPSVAEMAVQILRTDKEIINNFYEEALRAMRKGYDDETVNKKFLLRSYDYIELNSKKIFNAYKDEVHNDDNLEDIIDTLRKTFEEQYDKSNVEWCSYLSLCNAIAFYSLRYQIDEELTARFLTQYVLWFIKFGQHEFKRELMKFTKNIYDNINSDIYFQDREYMYDVYVMLLLKEEKHALEVIDIAKKHLKRSIKARDWEFASNWCTSATIAHKYLEEPVIATKYLIKAFAYSIRSILFNKKTKYKNSFITDAYSVTTRSLQLSEKGYEECVDCARISIFSLKMALYQRESKVTSQDMSENKLKIYMDKAKIKMLQNNFTDAKEEMSIIWEEYKKGTVNCTEALYESVDLLGEISLILAEYDNALNYYEECLKIAEELGYQEVSRVKVKIGRIYNLWDKLELSMDYNKKILKELEEKDIKASKINLADAYYNNAELHWLNLSTAEAMFYLNKAKEVYSMHEKWRNHCKIGKARCIAIEAQILLNQGNADEGNELMKSAMDMLESIFGSTTHPEIVKWKT